MNRLSVYLFAAIGAVWVLCAGCSGPKESGASRTGDIAAHALWPDHAQSRADASARSATLPAEVITVRGIVSGSDMDDVSQDFDASAGHGVITDIPVGKNRTLTLQGLDASGDVLYEGVTTGITVSAGETTDAGTIAMAAVDSSTGLVWDEGNWNDNSWQ